MPDRSPLDQGPSYQLANECVPMNLSEEISEFRNWRRDSAEYFIPSYAGEDDAISLRCQRSCQLSASLSSTSRRVWRERGSVCREFNQEAVLGAEINVQTAPAAFFFDL